LLLKQATTGKAVARIDAQIGVIHSLEERVNRARNGSQRRSERLGKRGLGRRGPKPELAGRWGFGEPPVGVIGVSRLEGGDCVLDREVVARRDDEPLSVQRAVRLTTRVFSRSGEQAARAGEGPVP
jgi:hypothetical protein